MQLGLYSLSFSFVSIVHVRLYSFFHDKGNSVGLVCICRMNMAKAKHAACIIYYSIISVIVASKILRLSKRKTVLLQFCYSPCTECVEDMFKFGINLLTNLYCTFSRADL
jgi:hypothetical protein